MSALSREIGPRGRADAVVVVEGEAPEPCPESDESELAALWSELAGMRLMALQKRAVSEGVDANTVDDAMDGDDPKAALISLIVEAVSSRGPVDRLLSALQAGGETAACGVSGGGSAIIVTSDDAARAPTPANGITGRTTPRRASSVYRMAANLPTDRRLQAEAKIA